MPQQFLPQHVAWPSGRAIQRVRDRLETRSTVSGPRRQQPDARTAPDLSATAPVRSPQRRVRSIDREDGFAFEIALAEGFQGACGIAPAHFQADLGLEAAGGDLAGEQAEIGAEGGRLA